MGLRLSRKPRDSWSSTIDRASVPADVLLGTASLGCPFVEGTSVIGAALRIETDPAFDVAAEGSAGA